MLWKTQIPIGPGASGMTVTGLPAACFGAKGGRFIRQSARAKSANIELSWCRAGHASSRPSRRHFRVALRYSCRMSFASKAQPRVAGISGGLGSRPWSDRIEDRMKRTAQTPDETGFPGRPSKGISLIRPKIRGLPGRIATFQKSKARPFSPSTRRTRSRSPTEAPPRVTTRSTSVRFGRTSLNASGLSRTKPRFQATDIAPLL